MVPTPIREQPQKSPSWIVLKYQDLMLFLRYFYINVLLFRMKDISINIISSDIFYRNFPTQSKFADIFWSEWHFGSSLQSKWTKTQRFFLIHVCYNKQLIKCLWINAFFWLFAYGHLSFALRILKILHLVLIICYFLLAVCFALSKSHNHNH